MHSSHLVAVSICFSNKSAGVWIRSCSVLLVMSSWVNDMRIDLVFARKI